jgi:biotin carboxylase
VEDFARAAALVGVDLRPIFHAGHPVDPDARLMDLTEVEEAAAAIASDHADARAIISADAAGVRVAARAASLLGLPHNDLGAVELTLDRSAMRAAFFDRGVPHPEYRVAAADDDVAHLARLVGLPCEVKPVALPGKRKVFRAGTEQEAADAAARVRDLLGSLAGAPDRGVMVERHLEGDEVAVEGLLRAGSLQVLAILDRNDPLRGPFCAETLFVTPTRLDVPAQREVVRVAEGAVAALGLTEGPVHVELHVDGQFVRVLDVLARPIRGLCSRSMRFGDRTLEEVILRHALDRLPGGAGSCEEGAGVMMVPVPRSGRLEAVCGVEDARSVPGIESVAITVGVGEHVVAPPEDDRCLGYLFARAETPGLVEQALRDAWACLDVSISERSSEVTRAQ